MAGPGRGSVRASVSLTLASENAKVLLALLCGLSIRCLDDDGPAVAKKCICRLMAQYVMMVRDT